MALPVKSRTEWLGQMKFESQMGAHKIQMDTKAPLGQDSAPSPKQVLMSSIAACTAMDVVSLLKKYRQEPTKFWIENESEQTGGQPSVFKEIKMIYFIEGEIESGKALEAVQLSMTRYCGVSAMVAKVSPILYTVVLNGREIGKGHAEFATEYLP